MNRWLAQVFVTASGLGLGLLSWVVAPVFPHLALLSGMAAVGLIMLVVLEVTAS